MKKMLVVFTVSSMIFSLPQPAIAANPKYGAPCPKLNVEKEFQYITYVCLKVKGKLVWTGKLSGPVDSSNKQAKKLPADYVDIKGRMIYGISNGMLTRITDSGKTFQADSRKLSDFDKTRIQAFNELNKYSRLTSHPNVEFEYLITPNYPKTLINYIKRELDEAASLWDGVFKNKVKVKVYLVTELDREVITENSWLNESLPRVLDRFASHGEIPFIAGSAIFLNNTKNAELYLATASDLQLTYVKSEWPEVAKHEFTHVVQDYFFNLNGKPNTPDEATYIKLKPVNYTEGSANTISFLTAFRNIGWTSDSIDKLLYENLRENQDSLKINSVSDARAAIVQTENRVSEKIFYMSYAIGLLVYEYVIAKYGFDGFKKLISETSKQQPYEDSIKNSLGISKDELYSAASSYIYSAVQRVKPYWK